MGKIARIAATRVGKVLLVLWLIALVILILAFVTGLFQGELLGNLTFVVLPVAALLNVSIILAHYVENGSVEITKASWIGIAVVALWVTLYGFYGKTNGDIWIVQTWSMLVLAFPAGLIVSLAHMVLDAGLSITVGTSSISLLIEWAAYFALGYMQWFELVPRLCRKWKVWRSRIAKL